MVAGAFFVVTGGVCCDEGLSVDRVSPALTGIGGFFSKEKHPVVPARMTAKPIKLIMVMTMEYMLVVFDLWLHQAEGALVDL